MKRPPLRQETPEARLAAVAANCAVDLEYLKRIPDFADYRDALAPFVAREILLARLAEAKTCGSARRAEDLELQLRHADYVLQLGTL